MKDIFDTLVSNGCWVKDLIGQPFLVAYSVSCGHLYTIEKVNGTIINTLDVSHCEFTQDDFKRYANTKFFSFIDTQESRQPTESEMASIINIISNSDMILKK
jgi:hypothetical protein